MINDYHIFMSLDEKKISYFKHYDFLKSEFPNHSQYEIEKALEGFVCTNLLHNLQDVIEWYDQQLKKNETTEEIVPLNNLDKWKFDNENSLVHDSGQFFKIIGIKVKNVLTREVSRPGWDQPIISEVGQVGGILGLVRTKINDLPHYLVEAKYEPGNYNKLLLSPTLQATFSNINQAHEGRKPNYYELFADFEDKKNYQFNNWLTEDGGRLYKKRNLGLIKYIPYENIQLKDGFIYLSLYQIKNLLSNHSIVNPHLARLAFL